MIEEPKIKGKHPMRLVDLSEAIKGKSASVPQFTAVHFLRNSNFSNKYKEFEKLLESSSVPDLLKYLIFIELGKIGTTRARNILLKNANKVKDEKLLIYILRGLVYCGDKNSIKTILKIRKNAKGQLLKQANLSADSNSYRSNLMERDFLVHRRDKYLKVPDRSDRIEFRSLNGGEIKRIITSIPDKPLGIRLAKRPIYEIKTGTMKHYLLLNEKFSTRKEITTLFKQKALLGLLIRQIEDKYSIMYLILTAPIKEQFKTNILLARTNGNIKFRGVAHLRNNIINFNLKSVLKPGNFPLSIEGNIAIYRSKLKIISAKFSPHVYRKRITIPETRT